MALSERRAELVRDALIAAGVPSARIDTSWLGEGKQDVPTPDDVAQQRNRVVDIVVQQPREGVSSLACGTGGGKGACLKAAAR